MTQNEDQCPRCFRFHTVGAACPYPTSWAIPERLIDRRPALRNYQRLPCGCPIDSGCDSQHDSAYLP